MFSTFALAKMVVLEEGKERGVLCTRDDVGQTS